MLKPKSPGKQSIFRYHLLACTAALAIFLGGAHAISQGNNAANLSQKDAMMMTEIGALP